ncbi:chromosome partitioning protein [Litorivivens lipolytica]|uniref:Chromosome partitioning protein n=1 Tax=Litorivivens lipolytica TaxID=1524264 RepID=A0A7W4W8M7_9GAMM|nr:AAA family ATPase [Litorivivens lipolytica]MBB3048884.1 chromosome partitioning protein [Litorivivens lipolytica]
MNRMSQPTIEELDSDLEVAIERGDKLFEGIQSGLLKELFPDLSQEAIEELGLGSKVMPKRFSMQEASSLLGVTRQAINKAEKEGRLPAPDTKPSADGRNIRAGFTLQQIENMRSVFGKLPAKFPETYVLGVLNQKGGAQKTTTTLFYAQWLAVQGYKVLIVDTDGQGSLTTWMGLKPDIDIGWEDTIAPFVIQDEHRWEEELGRDSRELNDLNYAVRKTYFHGIDLIPACGSLLEIDLYRNMTTKAPDVICQRVGLGRKFPATDILRFGLEPLRERYDIILLDGTPSLNLNTTNVLSACDRVLIPTPAHMIDIASTVQFVDQVRQVFKLFRDHDSARVSMGVNFLINRYSASEASYTAESMIRHIFKDMVLSTPVEKSDEVQREGNTLHTIYEVPNSLITNPKAHKRALENYEQVFTEVTNRVVRGIVPRDLDKVINMRESKTAV